MIRKAIMADKDAVAALYDDLHDFLAKGEDYTGWQKHVYPNERNAEDAISAGHMYLYTADERLAASIIINSVQPDGYRLADWPVKAADGEVLVIHTLVVRPGCSGRGIATRLLEFAEQTALDMGMKAVRLDTSDKNAPAAGLYEKHGYILAGVHDLGIECSKHKLFKCYEKPMR